jgi:hypothetical protein
MKTRAQRLTLATAAVGIAILGTFAALHWGTVRDHVESWRFQLTTETETIEPEPALQGIPMTLEASMSSSPGRRSVVGGNGARHARPVRGYEPSAILRVLASYSGRHAIFATDENSTPHSRIILGSRFEGVTAHIAREILEKNGYRVLEQRFPRRAYVVIREKYGTR